MLRITLTSTLCLSAFAAAQQDQMGLFFNAPTSFTSRGGTAAANSGNPAVISDKIESDYYAGFGYDTAAFLLGNRLLNGAFYILQDQIDTTAETYSVTVMTENVTTPNPDFPDPATQVTVGPFAYPLGTTGAASAFFITATFGTPAAVKIAQDAFVGLSLGQTVAPPAVWPADGLSNHMQSSATDVAGAAKPTTPIQKASNCVVYVAATPSLAYSTARQPHIEPMLAAATGATGAACTITNLATAPLSNVAPGMSSQLAGLFPDSRDPSFNVGRVDDFSERWFKTGTPDFDLVLFLRSFGGFGAEIPMELVGAGWKGLICIDFATLDVYGASTTLSGSATLTTTVPPGPGIRSVIAGATIVNQAVCIHAADGTWETNYCTKQSF